MHELRQAAARERQVPVLWWSLVMLVACGAFVWLLHRHSPLGAVLVAILLAAAWAAPLVAQHSLAAPKRPSRPAPVPGEGSFSDWLEQAHCLGRVLLYYEDNPNLPPDIRRGLRAAREDLRDTLRAHPLRDDLERVCSRVRAEAIEQAKAWFAREYRPDIRELANEYEQTMAAHMGENERLRALQRAVERAAGTMSCNCMPRMLERERLHCARDCAWLAVQATAVHIGRVSPVDLAEMLVIEWSDFSEPWQPDTAFRRALRRLETASPVPAPAAAPAAAAAVPEPGELVVRDGRTYRRLRLRSKHHRHRNRYRGPSLFDILISFGQWVRYSARAWWHYP